MKLQIGNVWQRAYLVQPSHSGTDHSSSQCPLSPQEGQSKKEQKVRVWQVWVPDIPEAEPGSAHPGGSRESEALPLPLRGLRLPVRAQAEHGQTRGWGTPETQTFRLSHLFKGKQIEHQYFHQTFQKSSFFWSTPYPFIIIELSWNLRKWGLGVGTKGGGWSIVPLELTPHAGIHLVWPLKASSSFFSELRSRDRMQFLVFDL